MTFMFQKKKKMYKSMPLPSIKPGFWHHQSIGNGAFSMPRTLQNLKIPSCLKVKEGYPVILGNTAYEFTELYGNYIITYIILNSFKFYQIGL